MSKRKDDPCRRDLITSEFNELPLDKKPSKFFSSLFFEITIQKNQKQGKEEGRRKTTPATKT